MNPHIQAGCEIPELTGYHLATVTKFQNHHLQQTS